MEIVEMHKHQTQTLPFLLHNHSLLFWVFFNKIKLYNGKVMSVGSDCGCF